MAARMARYKRSDSSQTLRIPVSLANQLLPGTLEFARQVLGERRLDTAIFASRYKNDETGCRAYDPKLVLQVILFAYARGLISSRKSEQGGREHLPFRALACGQVPDQSTIAAFVTSLKAAIASLLRNILLVGAEPGFLGSPPFA